MLIYSVLLCHNDHNHDNNGEKEDDHDHSSNNDESDNLGDDYDYEADCGVWMMVIMKIMKKMKMVAVYDREDVQWTFCMMP